MTQEELRKHQFNTNIKPTKKSYNIEDVIKRVDELESKNKILLDIIKNLGESVETLKETLTENGIYL